MTEFVGRTGSNRVYSYPETRRSGSDPLLAFARNYATGTKGGIEVGALGLEIPWNSVDAGLPPTTADVPITPVSTGVVLISGDTTINNPTGAPIDVTVTVHVAGSAGAEFSRTTLAAGATAAIPFLAESIPANTPVGVTTQIQVFVDGEGALLVADGSAVSVQEVAVATG